jgi:hypothetical protein
MNTASLQRIDGKLYAVIPDGPRLLISDSDAQQYDNWLLKLQNRDVYASKKIEKAEADKQKAELEHMRLHNPFRLRPKKH